jgi:2-polyprenyl-3-methyl-5-hydroxy-6-metoxy-1,4-benzoquinol methylase
MQSGKTFEQDLKKEREEYITDLLEYTQKSFDDVYRDLYRGEILMRDEWNEKNPQTPEEIHRFYKETKNYLYDLGNWHFGNPASAPGQRQFDVELLASCLKSKPKKVLDFGAGIGQNAYMLAREGIDVVVADVDSYTLDFAEWRFKKHHVPATFWRVDKEPAPNEKFDMILCFDVLEHIPLEEAKKTVELLGSLIASETKVLLTAPFGKTSLNPMHFNRNEELDKLIRKFLSKDVLYGSKDFLYTNTLKQFLSKEEEKG